VIILGGPTDLGEGLLDVEAGAKIILALSAKHQEENILKQKSL
jgi:hypothetical protein